MFTKINSVLLALQKLYVHTCALLPTADPTVQLHKSLIELQKECLLTWELPSRRKRATDLDFVHVTARNRRRGTRSPHVLLIIKILVIRALPGGEMAQLLCLISESAKFALSVQMSLVQCWEDANVIRSIDTEHTSI